MRSNLRVHVVRLLVILAFVDLVLASKAASDWLGVFFHHYVWWRPFTEWYWAVGFGCLFIALVVLVALLKEKPNHRVEAPMIDNAHTLQIEPKGHSGRARNG